MKISLKSLIVALTLIFVMSEGQAAPTESQKLASELYDILHLGDLIPQVSETFYDQLIKQNSQLQDYKTTINKFMAKYVNDQSLREETVTLYSQNFSTEELKTMVTYIKSPVGQKSMKLIPQLNNQAVQFLAKKFNDHQEELSKMISEEASRTKPAQPQQK
jgi:hypothetical protein